MINLDDKMDGISIWEQLIQFVKEERWDGEFTRDTDLTKDLKLYGDDAYEFICLFVDKFNLDDTEFDFCKYFAPEGDTTLSELINFILRKKELPKKKITLGDLEIAVEKGKLI